MTGDKHSLVLTNGHVLTMDREDSAAEAVAVSAGRIVQIGSNDDCLNSAVGDAEILDLRGATVVPGLVDPHLHLASDALNTDGAELRDFFDDVHSVAEILRRLRAFALGKGQDEWIVGVGSPMQRDRLDERRFPTREELDSAVPEQPCYLTFGAHVVVANSEALRRGGVTKDSVDPAGGTIERHPGTDEPNGILHERARLLVQRRPGDEAFHRAAIVSELNKCLRRGVTSIHDILRHRREVRLYQDLHEAGELPIRVHMIHRVVEAEFKLGSLIDLGLLPGFGDGFLRLGGVKVSIDGGITGGHGAFSPRPDGGGELDPIIRVTQKELEEAVDSHHEAGIRMCVHAIGDVALDMALGAFEKAETRSPSRLRHRIEHMGNWMCTPDRLGRAKRAGLTPVPNPAFLYYLGEQILELLGPSRLEDAFPFRTLMEHGFPLVFGSDGPAYWPADPLRDIGTAATHLTRGGEPFSADQVVSVRDGLRAQTINAAWLGMVERDLGSLEVGKIADIAVLADNPLTARPETLSGADVLATIVDGDVAYAAESLD